MSRHHDKKGEPLEFVVPANIERFRRSGISTVTDAKTGNTFCPENGRELAHLLNFAYFLGICSEEAGD